MKIKLNFLNLLIALALTAGPLGMISSEVAANSTAQPLPFSQDWSDIGLISTNDDWSGVLGIMGYRGDDLTSTTGTDPQTILQPDDPGVVDVNANQTNPNTFTTGGVTEFELTDPVVALAGSGTADAPYLLILINTTGMTTIQVSYDLLDLETGADNAVQQVALHYRVGNSGNFTNIPAAYVADATIGNATMTTHVSVTLPAAVDNAALVQLRIMTTNAVGNDEWVGVDNISITGTPVAGDTAPTVASTVPANGGTLAKDGDIVITFSEHVTVAEGWFDITCTVSGAHTAVVTDADPVYTLNPDVDFTGGESCTVTIYASNVNDDDLIDPPDYMEVDYTFTFTVALGCGDPYTAIPAIQGDGMSTPLSGQVVSTEGIVVADYQTNASVPGTRNGFFMQSVTPDADPNTSEGLFVYTTALDVVVGDHVRVTGKATEYNGLTQVSTVSQILVCSSGNSVEPTLFELPATDLLDFERFEGMLVTIPQDLVISEYYNFDRYGEIVLATERFMTFTAVNEPSVDGFAAWLNEFKLNSITLDDGRESQNPDPAIHPNGLEFTLENRFRGGDLVSDVTGVMDYEFSKYRIQPTQGANYTEANPRSETPELDPGFLKVASFNVLNYFTTIDTGAWICGPSGDMECRGADTTEELTRQRAKILAALSGIDADIFGIMEIENDRPLGEGESPDYAVADLVAGLNAEFGEGTFAYIATGAIGTDAIKQAIIYKPAAVTPVGDYQLLTTAVDSRFIDTLNRPVLAQVFEDNFTGETFVVSVNHLKSKGLACPDDPDLLDGQGNCNLTRKNAALALVDWLANPEYFLDVENALIIGDLNSYDHEDPIDMIKLGADDTADTDDDYSDMMAELRGESAYGYVYDGQIGYLDYALANVSLAERIVDVNFWHINADEPDLIDYDMTFKQDAQDELYAPDAYRSSDHDPVVISISFNAAPVAEDMEVSTPEDTAVDITLDVSDANDDPLTAEIVTGPMHGALVVEGLVVTYTPDADYNGPDSFTYKVSDDELESNEATVSVTVTPVNDAPVAVSFEVELQENSSVEFSLLASDVDGDTLTFSFASGPAHGTLNCAGAICTYTPDARWSGTDSFIFTANDGLLDSNEAAVTLNVIPLPRIYLPIIFR